MHARQTLEERIYKSRGVLNLWGVPKVIEGDELGTPDTVPGLTSEFRIAHGMPDDNWAYSTDMGKQSMRVGAKLV